MSVILGPVQGENWVASTYTGHDQSLADEMRTLKLSEYTNQDDCHVWDLNQSGGDSYANIYALADGEARIYGGYSAESNASVAYGIRIHHLVSLQLSNGQTYNEWYSEYMHLERTEQGSGSEYTIANTLAAWSNCSEKYSGGIWNNGLQGESLQVHAGDIIGRLTDEQGTVSASQNGYGFSFSSSGSHLHFRIFAVDSQTGELISIDPGSIAMSDALDAVTPQWSVAAALSDSRVDTLFGGALHIGDNSGVNAHLSAAMNAENLFGLYGGGGNDVLTGNSRDNSIWGGSGGSDILIGLVGNDTYYWGRGDGCDSIKASQFNGNDVIQFYNVYASELSYARKDNDLLCSIDGTRDVLTVEGWYDEANAGVRIVNAVYAEGSGVLLSKEVDGDAADLTAADAIYPEYSGYQTGYGHSDSAADVDYGMLYLGASGYFDISSSGNTAAYIYDATSGQALCGDNYQSRVYVDASHTNCLVVNGYTAGESYSVTVTASAARATDGDAADLTAADAIYPEYSGYQTGYGHSDSAADVDYGMLYLGASGYFDIGSSGNTAAYIYDATSGQALCGDSYQSRVYIDAAHTNCLVVNGYTAGENYSVMVTASAARATDGDAADLTAADAIYPEYAGYQTGYGHSDSVADVDYGMLYLGASGYFDIGSSGNTAAYIYDATSGQALCGDNYQSRVYIDAAHTNCIVVNGYAAGESYSVTVTASAARLFRLD